MTAEITVKITGEAGQGMQTIGSILCRTFKRAGYYIFANQDYMSRIRGGDNHFQFRVADKRVSTHREKADIIIALDGKRASSHFSTLVKDGLMILDTEKPEADNSDDRCLAIPLTRMAMQTGGTGLFINTVACGAVIGITGSEWGVLERVIQEAFQEKGKLMLDKNLSAAKAGYDFVTRNDQIKNGRFRLQAGNPIPSLLLSGNDAIALGVIQAGCKFYSAYPMSPSTGIMETLAGYAGRFHIVVEQAEDEIAAINMALGASFAGVRSMTATSGGGFALMCEGISLSGMTETPVVVVDSQRPGPATGFPTRTEQADMDFVIHAGHGEFARVVFTPGTAEQAFHLTVKAFNIAEKYQIPVIILSDQYLSDSLWNMDLPDLAGARPERHIIPRAESKDIRDYQRYKLTDSGISPRAIPSWIEGVIYADSDEHTESGHITEDAGLRMRMVEKRIHLKVKNLLMETEPPTSDRVQGSDLTLVGFGSTFGVMKEACDRSKDGKLSFVHLSQVWPFPVRETLKALDGAKRIITVENNSTGQLARLLKRECGLTVDGSILRFDGRPFNPDQLEIELEERLKP